MPPGHGRFPNDGRLDIIAGNDRQTNKLSLNHGSGGFASGGGTAVGSGTDDTWDVAVGCVVGDTWKDVIAANNGQVEKLYPNQMVDEVSPTGTVETQVIRIRVTRSWISGRLARY